MDDIYYYGGQSSHTREAVLPHEPVRKGELHLKPGDIIGRFIFGLLIFYSEVLNRFHKIVRKILLGNRVISFWQRFYGILYLIIFLGVAGNHWDGFSKGTNFRTSQLGLFPSFKVRDVMHTARFPTYPNVKLK